MVKLCQTGDKEGGGGVILVQLCMERKEWVLITLFAQAKKEGFQLLKFCAVNTSSWQTDPGRQPRDGATATANLITIIILTGKHFT